MKKLVIDCSKPIGDPEREKIVEMTQEEIELALSFAPEEADKTEALSDEMLAEILIKQQALEAVRKMTEEEKAELAKL